MTIINLAAFRQKKNEPPAADRAAVRVLACLDIDLPMGDALSLLAALRRAGLDDIAEQFETESEVTDDHD